VAAIVARIEQSMTRFAGDEWWAEKQSLADELMGVTPPASIDGDDYFDLDYFMALQDSDSPFVLPGMLRKNERWLIVGKEGGGKSALVYQILTGAAFGVNTLSYTFEHYQPQRVVFLDVENSEHQVGFNVRSVTRNLREMRPDVEPFWRSLKRRVVDLTDKAQAIHVIRSVVKHNPDVLYMGTAYKLAFSDDYRVMGRAIMDTIDKIRAEVGCSVLIEHHAGHGDKNNRNGWRADGTSEWGRWPDFARGLDVKMRPNGTRVMKLFVSSRMDRSAGREWPVGMIQGEVFPWTPIYDQDEFDESYGMLFPQAA
jgi:RecA-family ATPase